MAAVSIEYGTVQVFDDVVPGELYSELLETVSRLGWQYGWRSFNAMARYWHHEVAGGQKANTQDVTDVVGRHRYPVFTRYVEWLRSEVVPAEAPLLRLYLNAHTYGTDGSPHTDTERGRETTFILFLNQGWKPEYAGETVIFDAAGEIEHAVMPRENRLLVFPSERLHAPRPLSRLFGGLRVVLVGKFGAAG
jgi:Rps23 Pro-64 3,4-dihydroxylase Tpa1-like proline 4-hydroxylase